MQEPCQPQKETAPGCALVAKVVLKGGSLALDLRPISLLECKLHSVTAEVEMVMRDNAGGKDLLRAF